MDRELLLELKEFLAERMVDNMSTKDLVTYVTDDLNKYYEGVFDQDFLHPKNIPGWNSSSKIIETHQLFIQH